MAFLVSIGLFAYFWIVGFAVLGVLYRRNDLVRSTLIAPAVGILTVLDLLQHYPRRYLDRTSQVEIHDLRVGEEAIVNPLPGSGRASPLRRRHRGGTVRRAR